MRFSGRPLLLLILALGVLVAIAWVTVAHTTRGWFEKDVALRAELAVSGARRALLAEMAEGNTEGLTALLTDISRDERILAVALCSLDLEPLAATDRFPARIDCREVGHHLALSPDVSSAADHWGETRNLPGGAVHVSAIPLLDDQRPVGFVVLIHDLSFVQRREGSTQRFLLIAFVTLAMMASVVTLLTARVLWTRWSRTLREMAQGDGNMRRPEFVPLVRDLRDLLERLAREEHAELIGGLWSPERLKLTLRRHLHGERLIVAANREPYMHDRAQDGTIRVLHPASGLVSALEPVMRACSGVWVAHGAGSADRATVDAHDHVRVPPGEESYSLRRLWLTEEEERGYYYGFANEGLWPLCHVAHARPTFRAADWEHYRAVNRRFADAICQEADTDDPVVLVQDYHFALVPKMLRERLPRATIITFWHIPWPNAEQISICPWHVELVQGLLGSSILGFHTQFHCTTSSTPPIASSRRAWTGKTSRSSRSNAEP